MIDPNGVYAWALRWRGIEPGEECPECGGSGWIVYGSTASGYRQPWQGVAMGPARRAKRRRIREALRVQQSGRCCWCGGKMGPPAMRNSESPDSETLEHLVPRSLGGKEELENMALAHVRCNQERGVKMVTPPFRCGVHVPESREDT